MSKRRNYKQVADRPMSPRLEAQFLRQIAEADREGTETRVNFRWGQRQLALVKEVAARLGVPYQTYIKQVLYKQALEDLEKIERIVPRNK